MKERQLLSEDEYCAPGRNARMLHGDDRRGSDPQILESMISRASPRWSGSRGDDRMLSRRAGKRLKIIEAFIHPAIARVDDSQGMPVIPPDLRPLVPLDGGRFATSDLTTSIAASLTATIV